MKTSCKSCGCETAFYIGQYGTCGHCSHPIALHAYFCSWPGCSEFAIASAISMTCSRHSAGGAALTLSTPEGRENIANEIASMMRQRQAEREVIAQERNRTLQTLERLAVGEERTWPIFGAPGYFDGFAIIWPRLSGGLAPRSELRCRVYRCSSWTLIDLPEVIFIPQYVLGLGGTELQDAWVIDGLPPHPKCPLHRHVVYPEAPKP